VDKTSSFVFTDPTNSLNHGGEYHDEHKTDAPSLRQTFIDTTKATTRLKWQSGVGDRELARVMAKSHRGKHGSWNWAVILRLNFR
jgi:hypothetical protein